MTIYRFTVLKLLLLLSVVTMACNFSAPARVVDRLIGDEETPEAEVAAVSIEEPVEVVVEEPAAPAPLEELVVEEEPVLREVKPVRAAPVEPTDEVVVEEPATPASAPTTDVKSATIQIEAEGSFIDPASGEQLSSAGRGSGFIIDESGIAVTNNHVVTGAAFLNVRIGGQETTHRATVLGVSECSDLAVIDIDGGDYPYLSWYEGDIEPPLKVLTAGFPLGDPEFTMTAGIISKARANGDTDWASIESVVEHDATINPGNSGGPLVTEAGQVVGVNYAGNFDTNQYFAIGRDTALDIIEQLREGNDVDSIGINGQAFQVELDSGDIFSGIWVSSVQSGSAADKAGVRGGDIITHLEGLVMADDGTMADYCNILRSHDPEDTIGVEVVRLDTLECMGGQLNGREMREIDCATGRPLEESSQDNAAPEKNEEVAQNSNSAPAAPGGGNTGGGLGSFTLWGSNVSGSIGAGGEQWYTFNSNQEKEATLIAFMQNAEQVDLFIYHGKDIPVFPHHDPNSLANMGAATLDGNRDQNDKTKEYIWQGPVEPNTKYYVRIINRGGNSISYCMITRPDKYSCP